MHSALRSVTWKCFSNEILLTSVDFMSDTELQCRNAYSYELCGYLSIFTFIEWLQYHSEIKKRYVLEIGIDCESVYRLSCFYLVTPIFTFLCQVSRKIRLVSKSLHLCVKPIIIKAHRDNEVSCDEISIEKKTSAWCDF